MKSKRLIMIVLILLISMGTVGVYAAGETDNIVNGTKDATGTTKSASSETNNTVGETKNASSETKNETNKTKNSSSKSKNTSTQKGATSKTDITGAISSADDFIDDGKKEGTVINLEKFKGTNDAIYNSLLSIGVGIAVVVSGILGIQFMIGGAEEKANVKEKLTPFIIGCVVIFGAFGIWKIVTIILKNIAS